MRYCVFIIVISVLICSYCVVDSYAKKIVVSKEKMNLILIDECGDTVMNVPVACGINYGQKKRKGDHKTPEGVFKICQIQNSSSWSHDFRDGRGIVRNAYGPYFIRLETPGFSGIGIHGTCYPNSIGTRSSEGCIRLYNSDIVKLRGMVSVGDTCVVLPDVCN